MTPHEESQRKKFHEAIARIVGWRADALERVQAGILTAAILLHDDGTHYFGSDDLPESLEPREDEVDNARAAKGLKGVAFNLLKDATVIKRYFGTVEAEGILYGERLSKRGSRNGAHVRLWSLTSRDLAVAWLNTHRFQAPAVKHQKELSLL